MPRLGQPHMTPIVILERYPYRYIEAGTLDNGTPDYRIQKCDEYTNRYKDMYLLDNAMQLDYALEDFEYTKWLDPAGVPCYTKDTTRNYHAQQVSESN